MLRSYSFLVLTDHRTHRDQNPLYFLIPTLLKHPHCREIAIASRGNPANKGFFEGQDSNSLEVLAVDSQFVFDERGDQFTQTGNWVDPSTFDVILMRLPRPIPNGFLAFLTHNFPKTLFINHPTGIEETSNKKFLLNFPDLCPPMRLCYSKEAVLDFASQFPIVLKPLEEYGGKGIVKIANNRVSQDGQEIALETFLHTQKEFLEKEGYLAMKFLKNVSQGDKRILVVGGEILGGSLRLPASGSWLCNVAQGGTSVSAEIAPEEVEMIKRITPPLREKGILICGVDTLVDDTGIRVLSEINTLSVGGFSNLEEQSNRSILERTIYHIMHYLNDQQQ